MTTIFILTLAIGAVIGMMYTGLAVGNPND